MSADGGTPGSVCAVVLTYNRQTLLRACLDALAAQTHPPDAILVVDNAGSDGTPEWLRGAFPGAQVLRLDRNVGAAGGFAEGMRRAYAQGFDWLWVMDDDAYPRPDALERLLDHGGEADVLVPWQSDRFGELYGVLDWRVCPRNVAAQDVSAPRPVDLFAFVGALINRTAVGRHGVPFDDYFMDVFDWEYSLRLGQGGARVLLVPQSVIDHDFGRQVPRRAFGRFGPERLRSWQPAWKGYYFTRNYFLTLRRRSLGWRSYVLQARVQSREIVREVVFEPDGWRRAWLRAQAILDGCLGRSGERPGLAAPSTAKAGRAP